MTKQSLVLVVCFVCSTVYALGGDNTHEQGVRFAGLGLDDSVPQGLPQPVPSFQLTKGWPLPTTYTYETTLERNVKLKIVATCPGGSPPSPVQARFALCSGSASKTDPDGHTFKPLKICDQTSKSKADAPLLAIRAKWEGNQLKVTDDTVTFACAPTFPGSIKTLRDFATGMQPNPHQPSGPPGNTGTTVSINAEPKPTLLDMSNIDKSKNQGVLAKCFFWGFFDARELDWKAYEACVRAARADYCGNGKSLTKAGTWIQIYKTNPPPAGMNCSPTYLPPKLCFEALWDQNRALCVSHARFRQMPPQDCDPKSEFKFGFNIEGKPVAEDDAVVHCTLSDYQKAKDQSILKNRSFINDLNGVVHPCENDIPCP